MAILISILIRFKIVVKNHSSSNFLEKILTIQISNNILTQNNFFRSLNKGAFSKCRTGNKLIKYNCTLSM